MAFTLDKGIDKVACTLERLPISQLFILHDSLPLPLDHRGPGHRPT
jgi:hypothetical protein